MTDQQTPPDWILIEAAKRCGLLYSEVKQLRGAYEGKPYPGFNALCNMIERYEQPPVDPLVDALLEVFPRANGAVEMAKDLRSALADRGFAIVEMGNVK